MLQMILLPPRESEKYSEVKDLLEGAISILNVGANGSARTIGHCKSDMRAARDLVREAARTLEGNANAAHNGV